MPRPRRSRSTPASGAARLDRHGRRRTSSSGRVVVGADASRATTSQKPSAASRAGSRAHRVARRAHVVELGAPLGRFGQARVDRGALGRAELAVEVGREHVRHQLEIERGRSWPAHPVGDRARRATCGGRGGSASGRCRSARRWRRRSARRRGRSRHRARPARGSRPADPPSARWTSSERPVGTSSAAGEGGRTRPGSSGSGVGRSTLAAPDLVEEHVRHDPRQPAFQRSGLVTLEPLADSDERFLDQILCVVVIAGQAVRHVVEEAPVVARDLFPRGDAVSHGQERRNGGGSVPELQARAVRPAGTGTGAAQALLVSPSSSVSPSTPFLNSLLACPRDLASFGQPRAAEEQEDDGQDDEELGSAEVHGDDPFEGIPPGYLPPETTVSRRSGLGQHFQVVEGGHGERHRSQPRRSGSRRRAPPSPPPAPGPGRRCRPGDPAATGRA